ncbi:MAG: hypothetical protein HFI63_07465 [Lachnospiraceae bacterium]|nr:hypothetical protein [Lachnospiraceae bacterium]
MRGIRQWMADHGEVTGILVFLLIIIAVGGTSYGISYAAGGSSGKKSLPAPSGAETLAAAPSESLGNGLPKNAPADGEGPSVKPSESGAGEGTSAAMESESSMATGNTEPGTDPGASDTTKSGSGESSPSSEGQAQGDTFTEHGVHFQPVDEQVTAKIETNLRLVPSTERDEDVVTKIYNGDWIRRTGIGHNGWSRVEYEGQVLYAVTSYLSTDGSSSSAPTYQEASDSVTAKEEAYLRSAPDSSNDENIVATLTYGEFVTRTGIGSNGWSKLEYNGTEVYAVTNLLTTE